MHKDVTRDTAFPLKYYSFWTRLCRHRTVYLGTAFFLFQASPSHKPALRDGCDKRSETDSVLHTRGVPACAPLAATSTHSSQLCAGLKDWIPLCPSLVLLIFPTYSMSQWIFETEIWLAVLCPSPCPKTSPPLRSPAQKVHTCSPQWLQHAGLGWTNDQRENQTVLADREKETWWL